MKSFALVVNPVSGRGAARRAALQVSRHLQAEGFSTTLYETSGPGDATSWVSENQNGFDAVVAIGGDGTLREVIEGLSEQRTVGLVPVGTANVVSRDLHIPRNTRKAVRILAHGRTRRLDMGTVNRRPFLAMVGVGIDGAIVREVSERRSGPIRMTSYLMPGLRAWVAFRPEPLRVLVDGTALAEPLYGAVISNTRNYGGIFSVTPAACPDDGWLDYVVQSRRGRAALLRYGLAALLRRQISPRFGAYGRGRRIEISADSPVAVQVDGDTFGTTPVVVELVPGRVRILVPGTGPSEEPPA